MLREPIRAAGMLFFQRFCTRLFEGDYIVAMHGEPGWEPPGDPVLYHLVRKRQVWAEAQPLGGQNYKITICEFRSGVTLTDTPLGETYRYTVTWNNKQILSSQEALSVLEQFEERLEKEGYNGNLTVKPDALLDLRHFRRFTKPTGNVSRMTC